MRIAVTAYGVVAVTFTTIMYALDGWNRRFPLGFALGCVLSAGYGFLAGAWPFGVVELVWAAVALLRWSRTRRYPDRRLADLLRTMPGATSRSGLRGPRWRGKLGAGRTPCRPSAGAAPRSSPP